jgi:signal transduction histidine kinase
MLLDTPIWIAAGVMLVAGFYMGTRGSYDIGGLADVLAFVALPALSFELAYSARQPLLQPALIVVALAWVLISVAMRRDSLASFSITVRGVPALAGAWLGLMLGDAGHALNDSVKQAVDFPAKAALPVLSFVAGWGLNRATERVHLGGMPFVRRQSLGTKVVILFLAIGLLPLALMTGLNEQTGRESVDQQQRSILKTYSTSLASQLDNRLSSYRQDSLTLSQDPRLPQFLISPAARADPAGVDALSALTTYYQSDPTYLIAFLMDAKGVVQLSTNPDLYNKPDLSFREYYKTAIGGTHYASDITIGVNVPRPAGLFFASPVRDPAGRPIGVVVLRVDAEKGIWSLFKTGRIGEHRTALLVDGDGVVVGMSPESPMLDATVFKSLETLPPDVAARIKANQSFGPYQVTSLGLDPLMSGLHSALSGTTEFQLQGHQQVAGFAHLEGKPWSVVVFSDLETFLAPVHAATTRILAIAVVVALILILTALILARTVSDPLKALAQSAQKVAQGDLSQQLTAGSGDEIGKLTSAFNHMIEHMQQAQAELIRRADVQTELAQENARLYEQEREMVAELQHLNAIKADFISTVSHELRTPLTGISSLIQTLQRRDLAISEADREECLAEMKASADRLQAMVADLLQVSAIDAGRVDLQLESVSVDSLWHQLGKEFAAVEHPCQLVFEGAPNLPHVTADRLRLEQVLRNLIGNAIKYSPRGGLVQVRAELADGNVRFIVRDQGVGMTADEVDKLFTKFYRAGHVLTRKTQGTGLGLYISKSIVEAHGGHISIESEPGVGSTFYFTMKVAQPAELRSSA